MKKNKWDKEDDFVFEIGSAYSMKDLLNYSKYILLFIFLCVGIFTSINTKDPVLMIFVVIFFGTGWSAAQGLDEFGASMQRYKQAGDNVIAVFDSAIEAEKAKSKRKKVKK